MMIMRFCYDYVWAMMMMMNLRVDLQAMIMMKRVFFDDLETSMMMFRSHDDVDADDDVSIP